MQSLRRPRPFAQVNVFSHQPYAGNPVAVVLDGTNLTDSQMQDFARWTNLAETTFVCPSTTPEADYLLRIFTTVGELPFAGHPTLGSAQAWLSAGNRPHTPGVITQECAAGLVRISVPQPNDVALSALLAFTAPPTVRTDPLEPSVLEQLLAGCGLTPDQVVAHQWVDNGPGWCAVLLSTAEEVLAVEPQYPVLGDLKVGLVGVQPEGHPSYLEVRAFVGPESSEDPVTGSLNASLAQWLIRDGLAPTTYTASQGSRVGSDGQIHVSTEGPDVLIGGECTVCIDGTVVL